MESLTLKLENENREPIAVRDFVNALDRLQSLVFVAGEYLAQREEVRKKGAPTGVVKEACTLRIRRLETGSAVAEVSASEPTPLFPKLESLGGKSLELVTNLAKQAAKPCEPESFTHLVADKAYLHRLLGAIENWAPSRGSGAILTLTENGSPPVILTQKTRQRIHQLVRETQVDEISWSGQIQEINFGITNRSFLLTGGAGTIKCRFDEQHELLLREAVGQHSDVTVTGLAEFQAADGTTPTLITVQDVELTNEEIEALETVRVGSRTYSFKEPLVYVVRREGSHVFAEIDEYRLYAVGEDEKDARDELVRDLSSLYEAYAFERDDDLAPSGKELKNRLLAMIKEGAIDGAA